MMDDPLLPLLLSRRLAAGTAAPDAEPFPPGFFASPPRPAAVLVPLVRHPDGWHLLFIRRALHAGDRHSGEVAFPGGQVDTRDPSSEAAALREAEEEIGLAPDNVSVLGKLGAYRTVTNFRVTPVVGHILGPFTPRPDAREVSRVFSIPLGWLADPANLERRPRRLPGTETTIDVLYYRRFDGELLWGVTARLVAGFVTQIIPVVRAVARERASSKMT